MKVPNLTVAYPGVGTTTDYCDAIAQFPIKNRVSRNVELTLFEDSASQVRIISSTKQEKFTVSYENQSDAEKASFENFFDKRFETPSDGVFYFIDVRQSGFEFKVRFATAEVEFECTGPRSWSWVVHLVVVAS